MRCGEDGQAIVSVIARIKFGVMPRRVLPLVLCLVLAAAWAGCDILSTPSPAPTSTTAPVPTAFPTETPTTAATATPSAEGLVLQVAVAPVASNLPDYDRGEWRHWVDDDGDCQNARQEVLVEESLAAVAFESPDECRVKSGSWVGPYTGESVNRPSDLDVDHMVPLANAHLSGAWSWDRERKREFANFLGYDNHLIATTSSANRSKGAKGPEEWRPPLEAYWCDYATDWVTIKHSWQLTVTEAEYQALREMLDTCPMPVLLQRSDAPNDGPPPTGVIEQAPRRSSSPTPVPEPTHTPGPTPDPGPTPTLSPDLRYDPFGPDRDCGEFDTYEEAFAFFLAAGGPEEDPHHLDSDGDGEPCTSLPRSQSSAPQEGGHDPPAVLVSPYQPRQRDAGPTRVPPTPAATPSPTPPPPSPTATPVPTPTTAPVPDPTQTPTPDPTPSETQLAAPASSHSGLPHDPEGLDRSCSDFDSWWDAQNFYHAAGGPGSDPHNLDRNGDGVACESLAGSPVVVEFADTDPPESLDSTTGFVDRNCSDFVDWRSAQDFFESEGGPSRDPHRLDRNSDGVACESLSGAPGSSAPTTTLPVAASLSSNSPDEFEDRNCGDFDTWQEAQTFYEAEGGPGSDPHRLDGNGDGVACESLPGAP